MNEPTDPSPDSEAAKHMPSREHSAGPAGGIVDNRGASIGQQIIVQGDATLPDAKHLSAEWFSAQLDAAIVRAGPRYNPQLHTGHVLDDTVAALGDGDAWRRRREEWHHGTCQQI